MNEHISPLAQKPSSSDEPDYLVCTCMVVMRLEIVAAIAQGNRTFDALQETLLVGTGCSSCVEEVHKILKEKIGQ